MNLKENHLQPVLKKPDWLKIKLPKAGDYSYLKKYLRQYNLHTICESGCCPNIGECWENKTATFMILGDICTRSCSFCNVKTGKPFPPDYQEPTRIAEVISDMKLIHCVITSVDRDDLLDGGSDIWAMTITSIKELNPKTTIESLIPDFKGDKDLIMKIIKAGPNIISHNIETVERLTKMVRMKAKYDRSLDVLKFISSYGIKTKSGIMLGLGETSEEIIKTMDDILNSGCKILTIGQYLQPTKNHLPVNRYVTPEEFENYKFIALEKGFDYVECGPLVRSSYHGEKQISNTVN